MESEEVKFGRFQSNFAKAGISSYRMSPERINYCPLLDEYCAKVRSPFAKLLLIIHWTSSTRPLHNRTCTSNNKNNFDPDRRQSPEKSTDPGPLDGLCHRHKFCDFTCDVLATLNTGTSTCSLQFYQRNRGRSSTECPRKSSWLWWRSSRCWPSSSAGPPQAVSWHSRPGASTEFGSSFRGPERFGDVQTSWGSRTLQGAVAAVEIRSGDGEVSRVQIWGVRRKRK